jgi:polyisoprenoid-binding protein YceI
VTQTQEVVDLTTIEVPTPSTWVFDPTHTEIGIVARHLMVTKVRGRFSEFTGTIHLAEVPEESWAEVVVRADSIDTKTPDRDTHLRSADFLDAEVYPLAFVWHSDMWSTIKDILSDALSRRPM